MANVQIIKATKSRKAIFDNPAKKLRVAAYARVSTERDEQENSYEGQVNYYTRYISNHPTWVFVKVYADQGITGTSRRHRDGFNKMMDDALNGEMDLILVKSISRFGRNTVDIVDSCRKLKASGVDVIFEKENIQLFTTQGELMLTIFSSFAQEESRSISENILWTIRNNYKEGIYHMPYGRFLGYEKGPDGKPQIVEKEAEVVRKIYSLFIEGLNPTRIASVLTEEGIPTPSGKQKWSQTTIRSILTNEKYAGDAVLQKKYTADFLEHKLVKNEGQVDQYFLRDDHEGIVSHEVFDFVQGEIERRSKQPYSSGTSIFSGKMFCAECGGMYGSKIWHSTSRYKKVVFRCNNKYDNNKVCSTATLTEDIIKKAFVAVLQEFISEQETLDNYNLMLDTIADVSEYELKLSDAKTEMEVYSGKLEKLTTMSAGNFPADFNKRYDTLLSKLEAAEQTAYECTQKINEQKRKASALKMFISSLDSAKEKAGVFDPAAFNTLVEKILVDKTVLTFVFRDGNTADYSI